MGDDHMDNEADEPILHIDECEQLIRGEVEMLIEAKKRVLKAVLKARLKDQGNEYDGPQAEAKIDKYIEEKRLERIQDEAEAEVKDSFNENFFTFTSPACTSYISEMDADEVHQAEQGDACAKHKVIGMFVKRRKSGLSIPPGVLDVLADVLSEQAALDLKGDPKARKVTVAQALGMNERSLFSRDAERNRMVFNALSMLMSFSDMEEDPSTGEMVEIPPPDFASAKNYLYYNAKAMLGRHISLKAISHIADPRKEELEAQARK